MKQKILIVMAAARLTTHGFGQYIYLDNINNTGGPTATSNGRLYINVGGTTSLFDGIDYNPGITVYGGPNASQLTLMGTYTPFTESDGFTGYDFGTFELEDFYIPVPVAVPGVAPGALATIELQIWDYNDPNATGIFETYTDAVAGHDYVGTVTFKQFTSNPNANPQVPAPELVDMPSVILTQVPEQEVLGFAGLGLGVMLLLRPKSRWLRFHQNISVNREIAA